MFYIYSVTLDMFICSLRLDVFIYIYSDTSDAFINSVTSGVFIYNVMLDVFMLVLR